MLGLNHTCHDVGKPFELRVKYKVVLYKAMNNVTPTYLTCGQPRNTSNPCSAPLCVGEWWWCVCGYFLCVYVFVCKYAV